RAKHLESFRAFWKDPTAGPFRLNAEPIALRKDGTSIRVDLKVTYVPTSTGGLLYAFMTDITERRRTELMVETYTQELEYRAHQLRRLASALTLAEQHANERLARRLHGHLQQLLASSKSMLDLYARRVANKGGEDASLLDVARRGIDEASTEARAL